MEVNATWTSLDIAKLAVSALTPFLIGVLGLWASRALRNMERAHRETERIVNRRLEHYEEVGPRFNDLYCYFSQKGHWKEFAPLDVLSIKRQLDRTMYTYRPLYSENLFKIYMSFTSSTFRHFGESGTDAKLRTYGPYRKEIALSVGIPWSSEWDERFTNERDTASDVHKIYEDLMTGFARELQIGSNS